MYIADTIWSQIRKRIYLKNSIKLYGAWSFCSNNGKYLFFFFSFFF